LTFGGTSDLPSGCERWIIGREVIIFADNDHAGREHAAKKAALCSEVASSVKLIGFCDTKDGGDVTDWLDAGHTREQLASLIHETAEWSPSTDRLSASVTGSEWPTPRPLPEGLAKVPAFNLDFLPESIAPWVGDISDRLQCPADFVGISATVALGAVIGRQCGIRPQQKTDWLEVPNMWGCVIGRPGALKSPAMVEALKPLHHLEVQAQKANEAALRQYTLELEGYKIKKDHAIKQARKKLNPDITGLLDIPVPEEPLAHRYITNDTTYEALGEVLAANPNGVLAYRDELVSLLKTLDREEYAAARGFFLTAWNGTSLYTFDRIGRGTIQITACVSLLGSTQPGRMSEYVRRARSHGAGDDGLIQRFGLMVWPDQRPEWKNIDRYPDSEARNKAWATFKRLDKLVPLDIGAHQDELEPIPYLRFDGRAQARFDEWRADLEDRLRSGDLHAAVESHLAKYRGLVPTLALIDHIADGGTGPISEIPVLKALAYVEYLELHARRIYGAGSQGELTAAKAIVQHIRKGDLADEFSARDVYQRDWSNLDDHDQVQAGLNLLSELDWLEPEDLRTGGRPKTIYRINPKVLV
jgi:putative DNA primase/helicase